MKKVTILLFALFCAGAVFGQDRNCLGRDFTVAPNNSTISVGNLYTGGMCYPREKLIRLANDSTLLELREDDINNCSGDITQSYKVGGGVEMPLNDNILGEIKANHSSIKSANMVINDGHKKSLKNGSSDINDILKRLDIDILTNMLTDMKGKKAIFIVETIHINDGYTDINWKRPTHFDVIAKFDTIKGDITYDQQDSMTLHISYKSNVTAGYIPLKISKKKILPMKDRPEHKIFFDNGYNKYLAYGIINVGYPWTLGTSFMGRYGGIFGVGGYLSIGWDFGGNSTYDKNASVYTPSEGETPRKFIAPFHYSAGLKIFPYKNIFLSVGYGTLGCEKRNTFNNSEGHWETTGWRQGKGMIFTGGYDVLFGNRSDFRLFLSPSMGVSYNVHTTKWQPLIDLKFGFAWGLK